MLQMDLVQFVVCESSIEFIHVCIVPFHISIVPLSKRAGSGCKASVIKHGCSHQRPGVQLGLARSCSLSYASLTHRALDVATFCEDVHGRLRRLDTDTKISLA